MRLLVVEDEKKVASFVKRGLTEEGYAVDVAYDGEAGLEMVLDRVTVIYLRSRRVKFGTSMLNGLRRCSATETAMRETVITAVSRPRILKPLPMLNGEIP